jgi:hypothetical protein
MAEAFSEDFFLILDAAILLRNSLRKLAQNGLGVKRAAASREPGSYFLNKLSNAARASVALRGAGVGAGPRFTPSFALGAGALPCKESRDTVIRGSNISHVLAWSFRGMRTGICLVH